MGKRNGRPQRTKINGILFIVHGVRIRFIDLIFFRGVLLHVSHRQLVYREDTVLAARLDGHIGNRKTVIHGKIPDAVSHELHGFIQRTVHADHADDM